MRRYVTSLSERSSPMWTAGTDRHPGLSLLFFILSLMGNLTYGAGVSFQIYISPIFQLRAATDCYASRYCSTRRSGTTC